MHVLNYACHPRCHQAYGQTGSGKTYTMLGGGEGGSSSGEDSRGLIERVFEHLFLRIREKTEEAQVGLKVIARVACGMEVLVGFGT